VERHLAERPFLLGDEMTAADVMNGSMMSWAQDIGLLEGRDSIRAWVANLGTRPAYSRAMQKETEVPGAGRREAHERGH
jgi:glutathione S-transferase